MNIRKRKHSTNSLELEGGALSVQMLIEAGADVDKANKNGYTPLYKAAWKDHTSIVQMLIEAGADVNKADKDGMTPLYRAAWEGYTSIVQMLIEAGADVNKSRKMAGPRFIGLNYLTIHQ